MKRRLTSTHLSRQWLAEPAGVVRWLGAVQSQDFAGGKWALGLRLADTTDAEIETAFTNARIVRTHVLRPTWHFVAAEDVRWLLKLTAPHVNRTNASLYRKLELTPETFVRSCAAIERALGGGTHLTRDELRPVLEAVGIATKDSIRMACLMMFAELEALVCSGPRRGKQFTYGLLAERVGSSAPRDRDDALGELGLRYFLSHGPATERDLMVWSGLSAKDARRSVEVGAGRLARADVDGKTYWYDGESEPATVSGPTTHLLPNYDEYFIGFKDRSAIAMTGELGRLDPGSTTLNAHILTINGTVVGGWRRRHSRTTATVELDLLRTLTAGEMRSVTRAVRRYGEFCGLAGEVVTRS